MRRIFRRETQTAGEIREKINHEAEANRAYRLSIEMRKLSIELLAKAEQLEQELAYGRKA